MIESIDHVTVELSFFFATLWPSGLCVDCSLFIREKSSKFSVDFIKLHNVRYCKLISWVQVDEVFNYIGICIVYAKNLRQVHIKFENAVRGIIVTLRIARHFHTNSKKVDKKNKK